MSCSLHTVGTETLLDGLKNAQWTNYLPNKGCAVMAVANVACYYHQISFSFKNFTCHIVAVCYPIQSPSKNSKVS